MSRLIDVDALKTAIDNGWKPDMMVTEMWDIIDEMPPICVLELATDALHKIEEIQKELNEILGMINEVLDDG